MFLRKTTIRLRPTVCQHGSGLFEQIGKQQSSGAVVSAVDAPGDAQAVYAEKSFGPDGSVLQALRKRKWDCYASLSAPKMPIADII